MNYCLDTAEPELRELIERAMAHYANKQEYLERNLQRLSGAYPDFKDSCIDKVEELLAEMDAEQIVTISNAGLFLGAIGSSLGYPVKILDVHKPVNFQMYEREGDIHWYHILPKVISGDSRIYDPYDPSTIIMSDTDMEHSFKTGVIDFDEVREGLRTVLMDDIVDGGTTIAVANKRVLDLGSDVVGKIVIANPERMNGVIALDDILQN